ncbi:MAG TPA: GNAT family N-acetyltransferase [Rhodocyclaceae bacterium]|nr:GNAT family N-acetyltransferase [Rhodocyclaceae bacterium]
MTEDAMSAVDVSVRKVRADELPQLLQLYRCLNPNDVALPSMDIVAGTWQAMQVNPGMRVLAACAGDELLATATLVIVPNLTRGARPYALIENVVTAPAWRKRGIATRLLNAACEMAWAEDCYKVMLMTGRKDEPTLRFYRKAGFVDGDKTGFIARPA